MNLFSNDLNWVGPCGHQMSNPTTACATAPVCPFCRGAIVQIIIAKIKTSSDTEVDSSPTKARRSRKSNFSFKGLSATGSFGRIAGHISGMIDDAEKQ
ncbi:putative E3 ubiquitin-protein ligase XBAT31, partial [Mucuna pruriens]